MSEMTYNPNFGYKEEEQNVPVHSPLSHKLLKERNKEEW